MIDALKVMILEDRPTDQILIKRQALKHNSRCIFVMADNKTTFLEKIDWFLPNLILADYNLPDFTGLDALMYVKENKPFIPFIFITGGLNPSDPVAEVVLKLADGFILKDDMSALNEEVKSTLERMEEKIKAQNKRYEKEIIKKINVLKKIEALKKDKKNLDKNELLNLLEPNDDLN